MKKIEIPFGASDSEPYYQEIIIPDGLEAVMGDGKIILRRKETKDEKIRKNCIHFLELQKKYHASTVEIDECIAWLEKQSQVKSQHETCEENNDSLTCAEPKFKVGDWIVYHNSVYHIDKISGVYLTLSILDGTALVYHKSVLDSENTHLWTIADAKDGDVLVDVYGNIGIFQKKYDFDWVSYCSFGINGGFQSFEVEHENDKTHPATKEQHDLLFSKMKEAGWEWDAEKKAVKKIEAKLAWSENDERICQCLIRDQEKALDEINNDKYGHSEIISDLKEMYGERIDWLKSLKEKWRNNNDNKK